ncbi:hypothetical protein RRG08_033878 [Elysia crispata]|uniref:Uncharacterized protein n=1 Tax=Elysia crispata TaxID=231223 RepID=A0AAE1EC99_9GAST|nr:hypothetical protein RRG08_033878 [Elysia crispata]
MRVFSVFQRDDSEKCDLSRQGVGLLQKEKRSPPGVSFAACSGS